MAGFDVKSSTLPADSGLMKILHKIPATSMLKLRSSVPPLRMISCRVVSEDLLFPTLDIRGFLGSRVGGSKAEEDQRMKGVIFQSSISKLSGTTILRNNRLCSAFRILQTQQRLAGTGRPSLIKMGRSKLVFLINRQHIVYIGCI